jgi:hypothetical protein
LSDVSLPKICVFRIWFFCNDVFRWKSSKFFIWNIIVW